jgi:hypothetical protein
MKHMLISIMVSLVLMITTDNVVEAQAKKPQGCQIWTGHVYKEQWKALFRELQRQGYFQGYDGCRHIVRTNGELIASFMPQYALATMIGEHAAKCACWEVTH